MDSFEGRTALVTGGSRGSASASPQSLVEAGRQGGAHGPQARGAGRGGGVAGRPGRRRRRRRATPGTPSTAPSRGPHRRGDLRQPGHAGRQRRHQPGLRPDDGPRPRRLPQDPRHQRRLRRSDLVQQAWRAWMSEHGGSVLFVASVAGLRSSPMIGAYGVSKAALINLTTQLAVEMGPKVRVNAVAPAVVKTRFAEALYEGREEEVAAGYPVGPARCPRGHRRGRGLPAGRRRRLGHRPDAGPRRRVRLARALSAQSRPSTRDRTSSGSSSSR